MDLSDEVEPALAAIDAAVTEVENKITPLLNTPLNKLRLQLPPIDAAKLDISLAYTLNSLFWMYLCAQGESPKDHPVKEELDRIRQYMTRVKAAEKAASGITDSPTANSKLNKGAAKRFITAALNEQKPKKKTKLDTTESTTANVSEETTAKDSKSKHSKKDKKKSKKSKKDKKDKE
eukprot:m.257867 g.257867  ORF g.257867 m.257867 type:complete len:177 (+) comp35795_c0_seq1:180-710(+)